MTDAGTDLVPEMTALVMSAAQQADSPPSAGPCIVHGHAFSSRPKRRVFPGRPEQVACARCFIARVLVGCPAAEDAVLLTSELVTNALQHTATGTGGDFEVVACLSPKCVRVTVTDAGSPGTPALGPRTPLATSGQGLMLVTALAARWGHQGNQHGRAVWFELTCR